MALLRHRFFQNRWTLLGIMLFLTVGLFASSTLGWLWYADKRASAARQSSLDLLWMEQIISNKLGTQQVMLQNWALDLRPDSKQSRSEFIQRADELIKENHAILAVEIVDEQNQRILGAPQFDERPKQLPPLSDPLVQDAIHQSRSQNSAIYSRVIEQFAPLWVLALPNSNEQHPLHRIIVTYDLNKLLTQEVPWWFVQRYDLSLVDENDKQLSPSEGGIVNHHQQSNRIDFGPSGSGLSLKTSVRTVQNFDNLLIGLAIAVLLFGILIIWLLRLLQRWIKERKAAQQALRERDVLLQHTAQLSSLAEFASGMAHELNQPLAAIANYAAAAECLIEANEIESPKIKQAIEKMGEESRRAGKIMQSMRNLIQKSATPHEMYSLSRLVREAIELIEVQAKHRHIRIDFMFNIEDRPIRCDAVMLKQVLFNLMRNALDSMKTVSMKNEKNKIEHPHHKPNEHTQRLCVIVERNDRHIEFSVVDQGEGIQNMDKLFQAFYTTKSDGMGFGLAICRTVIENHGGKIWAENNPHGGATFRFRLPLETEQTQ